MNDLTQNQLATVLNAIAEQATGQKQIAPINSSEFVAVAQTALLAGYDNVIKAISQVLSRTIFSIRPYYRKLSGLQVTNQKFGNHTRKLNPVDGEWETDNRQPLEDGKSVDMFVVNKPKVLQTNFYGQAVYARHVTIFRDQLDVAFSSPEEFGRFISMVMTNIQNQIEQSHEGLARLCLANLIGGIITIGNAPQIVHLLSEYNTATGQSYTPVTIMAPETFKAFNQWAYSVVAGVSSMLTERTHIYHNNITGCSINRHTPTQMQKVYLYAPAMYQINSMVLADTYHDSYLRYADHETVNFWQSVDSKDQINLNCSYIDNTGTVRTADVTQANIFGLIMDEEAAGYTVINQWNAPTPFNADGGYSNLFWHFTDRYWNDFTENAVVLLLD